MFPRLLKAGLVLRNKFKVLKTAKPFNCCRRFVKIVESLDNMAISFLLPTLLMMVLISFQDSRQNLTIASENQPPSKILLIPRWYAELPNVDGCRFTYGYGGIYLDETRQKEEVLINGAANMAKNEKVFIKAGWAGSQTHSQGLNASYVIEKGWQDRASVLEKNLQIVREYRMGNSVIALCAFCPDESLLQDLMNQIDDRLVNINADDPPEWVSQPKSDPEYVYGIGTAQSRIKPGKAWEEAERQARADLALTLGARYHILQKTISENTSSRSQNLSETKVEIALKDVTIIRHAYSHADKSFYAQAQMRTPAHQINTD